jgi:hypothetical protein
MGIMTSNVPRDPEHYFPTEHAVLRKRRRGINWEQVSDAITEGRVHNRDANETCVFIHNTSDGMLYVAANHVTGAIATVAWYDQ